MPEIFGANKSEDIQEVKDLEKSGKFRSLFGSFVSDPTQDEI